MGSVYLGRQRGAAGFERLVAIKRMHRHLVQDPELTAAFHEEARIASLIRHPNVVTVVDVYEQSGEHLLVMDYVDGVSIASLHQTARRLGLKLPRPAALRIAVEALRGLHAAHALTGLDGRPMMVVHRDVSPQNILVGVDGSVKLTDFGIARALERNVRTGTGEIKGKLRYMSPEQAMGKPIDGRSDIFSLGIVLWEMLVGEKLYEAPSDLERLRLAADAQIAAPSQRDPSIPRELDQLVMRALQANPQARPSSAGEYADWIERWLWTSGTTCSAADVAGVVQHLLGDRVASRRAVALEIVQGKRAPEIRGVVPGHGVTPATSSLGAQSAPARRGTSKLIVGAMGALVLGVGGGVAIFLQTAPSPSRVGEPSALVLPEQPSARPDATSLVQVQVATTLALLEIRGDGVSDVKFTGEGASFSLPKGSQPIRVQFEFTGGLVVEKTVTPLANMALRLATDAAPSATASSSPSSAPSTKRPPPKGGPPAGGLRPLPSALRPEPP
jgi:tRNA A-37 threonylcarbamoyl transferase component Bud32